MRIRIALVVIALVSTALSISGAGVGTAAPAKAPKPRALVGTFRITPGSCDASGDVSGSYFKMVFPGGSVDQGKFFENPDSACINKTFTPAQPGTDGGLVTGRYQPQPNPPFDSNGSSLADRIIKPQGFTAINFSVSTNPTEPQTGKQVPKPAIKVKGRKLTGDLRAITASWNKQHFSQGTPKPDGSKPGLTQPVHGTYDTKTRNFVVEWASQIVGGPFNDFTGVWHLEGTFEPAKKSSK